MTRITTNHLNGLVSRMTATIGAPQGPAWTRAANGEQRSTVGALVLNIGNSTCGVSWGIAKIINPQGGEGTLIRARTAGELWDKAQAWLDGWEACERDARKRLGHSAYEGNAIYKAVKEPL
jgi:hypothetical protein